MIEQDHSRQGTLARLRIGWSRLVALPFEAIIAALTIQTAVQSLVTPQSSPVHAVVGGWDYVWAVMYGLSGVLIAAGVAGARRAVEAAGVVLLIGAVVVEGFALVEFIGWGAWPQVVTFTYVAGFAALQLRALLRGEVILRMKP